MRERGPGVRPRPVLHPDEVFGRVDVVGEVGDRGDDGFQTEVARGTHVRGWVPGLERYGTAVPSK